MAFEDLLKNFSILNQEPWNRPPEFPTPEVAPIVRGTDFTPMVRESLMGGMQFAEPDMEAAKSRASQNVGPALFLLPLMLAGAKNKKRALSRFAKSLGTSVDRELRSQNAMEVWRAEQINARNQALLDEIKQNKGLMEKIAEKDPLLWTDEGFVNAWMSGDVTYLARSGWKPPVEKQKKSYQMREMGGRMVVFDPDTGQVTRDLGPAKAPGIGGGKAVSGAKALENQIWEETLRILYSKGPGALTPMQIEMAKAKKLLDKDYGKPNIKEIVKDNMIILYDIDNQKIIQEIPFGNPVPESSDVTRTDAEQIWTMVMGGTDRVGTRYDGLANVAKSPEQLENMIYNLYGHNHAYYQKAMSYGFDTQGGRWYGKRPQRGATPKPAETKEVSPLDKWGIAPTKPKEEERPAPREEAKPAPEKPASGKPQGKDYMGLAKKLLNGPNVKGDKAKALQYIKTANISEEDKVNLAAAVEQLTRVR